MAFSRDTILAQMQTPFGNKLKKTSFKAPKWLDCGTSVTIFPEKLFAFSSVLPDTGPRSNDSLI